MDKQFKEKLITWITESGHPIELKAGKYFHNKDWNLSYNRYFLDKDEQKGREIDICAFKRLTEYLKNDLSIGIHIIAEVKYGKKDRPWVFFMTPFKSYEGNQGYGRLHVKQNISADVLSYQEIEKKSEFSSVKQLGRSYLEAFSKRDNISARIFEALTKAVKAAEYVLEVNQEAHKTITPQDSTEKHIEFVEPAVIFDGELFEAFLNDKEEIELVPNNHILVGFDYKSKAYQRHDYTVHVLTMSALPGYIANKESWLKGMADSIISKAKK